MVAKSRVFNMFACMLVCISLSTSFVAAQTREKPATDVSIKKVLSTAGIIREVKESPYGETQILAAFQKGATISAPYNPYYIIGPKDKLIISLWGKRTQTFNPVVDENGFVNLKVDDTDIRFSVNGILFKDVREKVIRELAKLSSDIDPQNPESSRTLVDVTLGEIRGINIMVLGEVKNPGQYTMLTTVGSVFNALSMAGGITADGSLREIMVRRPGGNIDSIDLYSLDLYALLTSGVVEEELFHLQEGDMLVVPTKRRVVTLSGEVRRPGAYEILEGETLGRLVELAGDFEANADPHTIKILRVKGCGEDMFMNIDFEVDHALALMDGDAIQVVAKPETRRLNIVEIKGEGVKHPGRYEFKEDMTLADLLREAEGLHEDAMTDAAVLVRTRKDYSLDFRTLNLDEILKEDGGKSFGLVPLDKVIVYSRFNKEGGDKYVTISGHLKEPGEYLLSANMTLADLLFMAGGFTDPDYLRATWLERADIIRMDEATQQKKILSVNLRKVLDGDEKEDMLLRSGDAVRVYAFEDMQDKRFVSIAGEVRLPGRYELTQGMVLEDLVSLASGLTETADRERIEIARFPEPDQSDATSARSFIVSLNQSDGSSEKLELQRNDNVVVRRRTELRDKGTVSVGGEVVYPGDYVLLSRTETLSDIIERAGGFIEGAAPEASRLIRRVREATEEKPAEKSDIVVDLAAALKGRHGRYDLVLLDGDRIEVPRQQWTVEVKGEVLFPRTVQFVKGKPASFYLDTVGGFARSADKRGAVVVYPNGQVKKAKRWFFSATVKPGSTIFVPAKAKRDSKRKDDEKPVTEVTVKTSPVS